jgi:hypothetical protein
MRGTPHIALPPRGLSRVEAAAYVGVSPTTFDALVRDGLMPGPKRVRARVLWDRHRLDAAFDALPGEDPPGQDDEDNEWDAA